MKTKNIVFATLLISMGLVLNIMTPAFVGLMKPDFLLALFLIALTQVNKNHEIVIITVMCAVMSSVTTMMPGAEVANLAEKMLTGLSVSFVYKLVRNRSDNIIALIIGGGGTMLSGIFFLSTMNLLGFLEANVIVLLATVVIPTSLINIFIFALFRKTFRNKVH